MKNSIRKRILALMICLSMVLNGSVSFAAEDNGVEEVTSTNVEEVVEGNGEEVVEEDDITSEMTEEMETTVETETEQVVEETTEIDTYVWTEEGVTVTVIEKVPGAIPDGSFLSVTPITEGDEYIAVETQLNEKAANEEFAIAGFLAYDIKIVDAVGNKIEPNDSVKVSIEYEEAAIPESVTSTEDVDVTVMHFEEDENGEVAQIVDMVADEEIVAEVTTNDAAAVETAEFETESFSTFTLTWKSSTGRDRSVTGTMVDSSGNVINLRANQTLDFSDIENNKLVIDKDDFSNITDSNGYEYKFVKVVASTSSSYDSSNSNNIDVASIEYIDNRYYINGDTNYRYGDNYNRYKLYFVYERIIKNTSLTVTAVEESDSNTPLADYPYQTITVTQGEPYVFAEKLGTVTINNSVYVFKEAQANGQKIDQITYEQINGGLTSVTLIYQKTASLIGYLVNTNHEPIQGIDPITIVLTPDSDPCYVENTYDGAAGEGYGLLKAVIAPNTDKIDEGIEIYTLAYDGTTITYQTSYYSDPVALPSNMNVYLVYETLHTVTAEIVESDGKSIAAINPSTVNINLGTDEEYIFEYNHTHITINDSSNVTTTYRYIRSVLATGTDKVSDAPRVYAIKYDGEKVLYKLRDIDQWKPLGENDKIYLLYNDPYTLTEVATVEHEPAGVKVYMNNFSTTTSDANYLSLGGGWKDGSISQGLVKSNLGADGYPVVTANNGSIAQAFDGKVPVEKLFLLYKYEETGYYEYCSFDNYAYLGSDNNFTVYEEIATPENGSNNYYKRGNFTPYNGLIGKNGATYFSSNYNQYDEYCNPMDTRDPRYNERLYLPVDANGNKLSGQTNQFEYHFAMQLEAAFAQPKDGQVEFNGNVSNMRYEFNGDDDLWVFIDDVLVLDIGGIHIAHSGYIDFATGEIGWFDGNDGDVPELSTTRIETIFRNALKEAGKTNTEIEEYMSKYFEAIPDATPEDTSDDTYRFKDYTNHTLKMFYLERGKGASNLDVKFNIPVIPEGTFEVTKELTNTDKEKYANVDFAFQAFAQEEVTDDFGNISYTDNYVPLTNATYKADGSAVTFDNDVTFEDQPGQEYDNVFYLKPGQTAVFEDMHPTRKYYVVEVGVNAQEFDKVVINGVKHTEYSPEQQENAVSSNMETSKDTVANRMSVVYENNCSSYNSRELRITKAMQTGQTSTDRFTFRVMIEDTEGQLVPYIGSYYMLDKDGNYMYYNDDNRLVSNGNESILCGSTTDGRIANIAQGYTVVITGLLSETDFAVSEVNLGSNYNSPEKTLLANSYDAATIVGADGSIKLGTDAEVTITNSFKSTLVEKIWVDAEDLYGTRPPSINLMISWSIDNEDKESSGYAIDKSTENDFEFTLAGDGRTQTTAVVIIDEQEYTLTITNVSPWKASILGLPTDYDISFVETEIPAGYDSTGLSTYNTTTRVHEITNTLKTDVIKISSNSDSLKLAGAVFKLENADKSRVYYAESNANGTLSWFTENPAASENTATTTLAQVQKGVYTFTEIKAPAGYSINPTVWTVEIENGQFYLTHIDNVPDNVPRVTDYVKKFESEELDHVSFYFENTPVYELPSSGGFGIYTYMFGGIVLMIFATFVLYKNRRKEVLVR